MHTFFREVLYFFGGFLGAKIEKSEYNLENIRKSSKHNLNNNFVGDFNIFSKGSRQIWRMPRPFKKSVTISRCFFLADTTSKPNITLKIFQNMTKIT